MHFEKIKLIQAVEAIHSVNLSYNLQRAYQRGTETFG